MAFKNRIRLPLKITRAQFPEERQSFRKANGQVKTLSVVVRKTYEGETDYLPEKWHERLKIALAHDTVLIEGEKYAGEIAQEGEYNIEWPDFMDYPTAKADFTVQVTPFNGTNANCQTCAEAVQLSLEDDTFPDPLEEGETYDINLSSNDSICCYPATFSLQGYNSDFLSDASINPTTGILTVSLNTQLISANELLIATYRVTCPNGGYDEAKVFANIVGSEIGCLAPTSLGSYSPTTSSISFSWVAPVSIPANGYAWDIRKVSAPGVVVQSGNTASTSIIVSGLDANTAYTFNVWSICGEDNISNTIFINASTIPNTASCGNYQVFYDNGTGNVGDSTNISYINCVGDKQSVVIFNMSSVIICARQTSEGNPQSIIVPIGSIINYLGLC